VFTSARINHTLAQKVVEGMEKVADNIKRKCREATPSSAPTRIQLKNAMTGVRASSVTERRANGHTDGDDSSSAGLAISGTGQHTAANLPQSLGEEPTLAFPPIDPGPTPFNFDFSFPEALAGLDLFNFFDESTNMDVGEMDSMFDRNLDPMAPAFWPAYPSLDPERIDQGATFFP
jgi:hypothetical protein